MGQTYVGLGVSAHLAGQGLGAAINPIWIAISVHRIRLNFHKKSIGFAKPNNNEYLQL